MADLFGNGKQEVVVSTEATPDGTCLYCLNGTTGARIWSFNNGRGVYASPVVSDLWRNGKLEVIAVSFDYTVYCLNGTTGAKLWNCNTSAWIYNPSPVVSDLWGNGKKEVIIGNQAGTLYCLNGSTGAKLWSYNSGSAIYVDATVADVAGSHLPEVLVDSGNTVHCLNGTTGTALWTNNVGKFLDQNPVIASDLWGNGKKEVIVGGGGGIYCLNGTTGVTLWSYATGRVYRSPILSDVFGNGKLEVIFGSDDSNVYCLNGTTGTKFWSYAVTATRAIFGLVVCDLWRNGYEEVIAGSDDHNYYCLSGFTGKRLWSYDTGGIAMNAPVVADLFGTGREEVVLISEGGYDGHWFQGPVYCLTSSPDTIPPATITDLAASRPTYTSMNLTWTAPGDDGMNGKATGYIVKYSTIGDITASNWSSATTYAQSWTPTKNGTKETHIITDLRPATTYWFAIEAYDALPNYGGVSNSPSNTTLVAPAPTIDQPGNVTYAVGQTGNNITWHPTSQIPDYYAISVDGAYPTDYTWSGQAIIYNVDGLSAGTHSVNCTVYDTQGRSASSTVTVMVQLPSSPFPIGIAILGVGGAVATVVVVVVVKLRLAKKGL